MIYASSFRLTLQQKEKNFFRRRKILDNKIHIHTFRHPNRSNSILNDEVESKMIMPIYNTSIRNERELSKSRVTWLYRHI